MYNIKAGSDFVEQFKDIDFYTILRVCKMIEFLRENLLRYKSLTEFGCFRIRFKDVMKEKVDMFC